MVKRTWPASVWRWMKVALSGAREQLLAVLRGDLDEIAQHVVVAHLQRAHAGLVGVARLQRRDHAARFIAQRAGLVERRVVAGAHEAAVALQIGQVVGERRRERRDDRIVRRRQRARRLGDLVGQFPSAASRARKLRAAARPSRIAARSRGPPRSSTSRASERARSGAAASCDRTSARAAPSRDEQRDRIEPPADRRRIGERRREPLAQEPRARRPSRCGRSRRTSEPRRSPDERAHQFEVGARRRIDRRASCRRPRASAARAAGGCPSCVRST